MALVSYLISPRVVCRIQGHCRRGGFQDGCISSDDYVSPLDMSKGLERSNIKNTNVECYDQFAPFYQMHYGGISPSVTVRQWATKLADLGYIPAKTSKFERGKMRLVDIGCGPGAFLLYWA